MMPIIHHRDQALIQHSYRRIVTQAEGALSCTVWDQTLPPSGVIPLHAHQTEETLTLLSGQLIVTLAEQTTLVEPDTTILIPPGVFHSLRNDTATPARMLVFLPTATPVIVSTDGSVRAME
jgi:quercetin dioxygenase-like cupin family protein